MYDLGSFQVTIPAGELGGSLTIDFNYDLLEFGDSRTLALTLDIGDNMPNSSRNTFELDFVKFCTLNNVELSITTDDYAEETYYGLFDLSGSSPELLLSNSAGDYDGRNNETITEKFCLDSGNYAIVVYDTYGDGIVDGGVTVSINGTVEVSQAVKANFLLNFDIE